MEWVASTLHTTSEHGISCITTAHAHTPAANSRLKWTRPFRRKTKCGFCACAITFQTQYTYQLCVCQLPACYGAGVKTQCVTDPHLVLRPYSFFNLGARWGGRSTPRPGRFTPAKDPKPIVQGLGGPHGWSGQVRKYSPTLGFDPRTVRPVASRYTD